ALPAGGRQRPGHPRRADAGDGETVPFRHVPVRNFLARACRRRGRMPGPGRDVLRVAGAGGGSAGPAWLYPWYRLRPADGHGAVLPRSRARLLRYSRLLRLPLSVLAPALALALLAVAPASARVAS